MTGRVLILLPFSFVGAVEDYATLLAAGLLDRGWQVSVLHPEDIDLPSAASLTSRGLSLVAARKRDLVHPVRHWRLLRTLPSPDVIHINHVFLPGMAAAAHSRSAVVVMAHTPAEAPYSWKGRALVRWTAPRMDGWIALSPRNAESLSKRVSVPRDRVTVIPYGLPPKRFRGSGGLAARRKLSLPPDALVVGMVARLVSEKRHDLLIQAARLAVDRIPGLFLVLIGDGERRHEIQRLAERELPGRVLITGNRSDVVRLLPALDVFCLPSDYEGGPLALLEAMAMGLPSIVTDVPGSGERISDQAEGLIVPPGDSQALARAIETLAKSPRLREEFGGRARARFRREFTVDRMVEKTASLYGSLMSSKDAP